MNILEYEMIELLKPLKENMVFLKLKLNTKMKVVDKMN